MISTCLPIQPATLQVTAVLQDLVAECDVRLEVIVGKVAGTITIVVAATPLATCQPGCCAPLYVTLRLLIFTMLGYCLIIKRVANDPLSAHSLAQHQERTDRA